MRPLHGYAEPMVARSPSSWSNEHIALALIEKLSIDFLHVHCYLWIVHRREVVIHLHIHHIRNVLTDAMSQRVVGAQQALLVGNLRQVFLEHLFAIHYRTYLEEIEL